ncbi:MULTISPECIES: hypothetical protein [Burkholderia]|nr:MULTISPECIES: hypothetical protein [Burkholderia]
MPRHDPPRHCALILEFRQPDWLRLAIDGIRVMHFDDDERRRVAKQLF